MTPCSRARFSTDGRRGARAAAWLAAAAAVTAAPWAASWLARRPWRAHVRERLGLRRAWREVPPGSLWIHGASVGEVRALAPLVARLGTCQPRPLLLTALTPTGRAAAERVARGSVPVRAFPVDLPWVVASVLGRVRPCAVLLSETELWPNFLAAAERRRIAVALVNARLSARAFRRYRALAWVFRPLVAGLRLCCVQTEADAARLRALGALPDRITVTGSLKFAAAAAALGHPALGLFPDCAGPVLVAGSTHAGEEAAVLTAAQLLRDRHPGLLVILAPRHPERWDEVEALLRSRKVRYRRHSAGTVDREGVLPEVILLDTLGELEQVYSLADVVFVGGSLVPRGGHNLLEPAAAGKAVLFGPCVENVREAAEALLSAGAGVEVTDASDLARAAARLLSDRAAASAAGARAREVVESGAAAVERTLAALMPLLGGG